MEGIFRMKILRWLAAICLPMLLLGIAAIFLLPCFSLDAQINSGILSLLTGLISGAFLALVTTYCEIRIRYSSQKKYYIKPVLQ